jgi:hypothetical protein
VVSVHFFNLDRIAQRKTTKIRKLGSTRNERTGRKEAMQDTKNRTARTAQPARDRHNSTGRTKLPEQLPTKGFQHKTA